ncbi:hypothetical protein [Cellulomonas sp. P24]|uniref:hypothetical protein n=1 Tax=Cellulomonas sp. P24 TaxID=2885206 RepID=UPI00216B19C5|nr:hypothetical protein [Cellulomonas sp. P24]MCR6493711.1 hypothetical protein [Cellulomonas sp. P24]
MSETAVSGTPGEPSSTDPSSGLQDAAPAQDDATSSGGQPSVARAATDAPVKEGDAGAAGTAGRRRHVVPDDAPVIPDRSADDSDLGWGDGPDSNDDRLRRDVPPHW